jgi:integrase
MRLFEGGPDMAKLKRLAASAAAQVESANTRNAYASDWKIFDAWCHSCGRKALPSREETLCLFAASQAETFKMSTVERRLAAISSQHRANGFDYSAGREVRAVMRGLRREHGAAQEGKAALRVDDLRKICTQLRSSQTEQGVRDRALLVLGFSAALRRSEISALRVDDLKAVSKGLLIKIRKSKTDQESRGRDVGVFRGSRTATDPVNALKEWLYLRGKEAGFLFPGYVPGKPLTGAAINQIVKRCVAMIGLNPAAYGAHSLRAGFVTAAAEAGTPETLIMQRTGHRSVQTVARYVRPAHAFSSDALARAL